MRAMRQTPTTTTKPACGAFVLNLNEPGEGRAESSGAWFVNVNSVAHVLHGPARVGLVDVQPLPQRIEALERHLHTAEILTPIAGQVAVVLAPASDRKLPLSSECSTAVLDVGEVLVIPPGVWHSAACAIGSATKYLWLNQAEEGRPEGWVALDQPINLTEDALAVAR